MGKNENPSSNAEYLVGIDPDAMFSVFYQDLRGRLIFSIDVDDDPKKIYLNPRPTEGGQVVNILDTAVSSRVSLAVERVKAYFKSQGLSVYLD